MIRHGQLAVARCLVLPGTRSAHAYVAGKKPRSLSNLEDELAYSMAAAITGESPAKAARGSMPVKVEARMQRSMMMHATAKAHRRMAETEEIDYLEHNMDDAIEIVAPHVVRSDKTVLDTDGSPIVWPWEADMMRALPSSGVPHRSSDAMIERAMLAASADGRSGESLTGVRAWKAFCKDVGMACMRPLDPNAPLAVKLREEHRCMQFVCELVEERGVGPTTAANYFSQVQGWQLRTCGVKLCGGLKLGRLPAMLKGLRRIVGETPRAVRRGIAPSALQRAMDLCLDANDPLHANIRAALTCALQGLLRSAEYCDNGKTKGGLQKLLKKLPTRDDIQQLDEEKLVFMTCPCKNMRHLNGKTGPVVIGAGGSQIDACAEVKNLLQVDPTPNGEADETPLFRDPATNMPLTYSHMQALIKQMMHAIGEDSDEFGTHSLRIGGATALFAQGATPMVIRTMGRWSSDCYRLYVRACFEASVAWTRKAGSTKFTDLAGEFDEVDDY